MVLTSEEHAEDLDKSVFPGMQGGPLMHNVAGKAVGFKEALQPEFREYAAQTVTNAKVVADVLNDAGIRLVSGGTDKHLVLVDLRESHPDLTGEEAEAALESVGITVNKNTVPGETRSPFVTSGIRIGTPALTTRGFDEDATARVAEHIVDRLDHPDDDAVANRISADVDRLCERYPIYGD
jgi:glycine hydroxymethyltransferase